MTKTATTMKTVTLLFIALCIAFATGTGCSKPSGGTVLNLPNVANFSIDAITSFVPGAAATVTISAPDLGSGTFTINFNLVSTTTPADNLTNQTATFTMSGSTATFNTPAIPSGGNVSLVVNSISNSSGSSTVTSNNSRSFYDSTGLMTCKINGNTFRATDVKASLAGSGGILAIHGVLWNPLTTITLYWDNYTTGTTGTIYYSSGDLTPGSVTSTFNGSAAYGAPGIAQLSQHGALTISSYTPAMSGSFSFVNDDSSAVTTGTFSCPHP